MSRSGYIDDDDDILALGRWRAQVASATRGKRGQKFLRDLLAALDAMPVKRLIANDLRIDGSGGVYGDSEIIVGADELVACDGTVSAMGDVCALGALGVARGMDIDKLDPQDSEGVAAAFDIANPLACEVVYENDECSPWNNGVRETPEQRWRRVRAWVAKQIKPAAEAEGASGIVAAGE